METEITSFILGVCTIIAIIIVVGTFINILQIKKIKKEIQLLNSTDESILRDINALENKIYNIIKEIEYDQNKKNNDIISYIDSRVDKLENKIYKDFDIKKTQSNTY
jgi:predicted PurR-regulated permease PerM